MNQDELTAVAAVLNDKLHTTDDDELQAALWQLLTYTTRIERRAQVAAEILVG